MKSLDPSLRDACEELLQKESSVEPFFRSLFVDVPSAQPALPSMTTAVPTTVQVTVPIPTMPEETKTIVRPPSPPKAVEEEDDFFSRVCCGFSMRCQSHVTCFASHHCQTNRTLLSIQLPLDDLLEQSATYCTRSLVRPAREMRPVRSM